MGRFRMLMCYAMLLSFTSGCTEKQATLANRAEDERAVRELQTEASKALAAKDLDKLVSLYADNAGLYDERDPIILGKNAISKTWKADFSRPGLVMSIEPRTVEVSSGGDLAWVHGIYQITIDSADKPVKDQWEYALVYKKQPDGKWKIMADSVNSALHTHLFHKLPKGSQRHASLAPLIGLGCFGSGIWFLFAMPIIVIVCGWKSYRSRKLSTGFIVSTLMLIAFYLAAVLLWRHLATYYWNLSLKEAFAAAGDTARYGNPVEDTAEGVLVTLFILSTFSALAAGVITGAARWVWTRYRRPAV